jgi:hypothetical protein
MFGNGMMTGGGGGGINLGGKCMGKISTKYLYFAK